MAGLYMNGDFVRDRMKALGLKQRDVADALGLPQSAISNIIKGKRRIKVEEADKLIPLLGEDPSKLRELPVMPIGRLGGWLHGNDKPTLMAQSNHTGVSDNSVFVEMDAGDSGLLPGVLHILVDLDKRSLYSGEVYLTEAGEDFHFYRFKEAPARLQPMPPVGDRSVLQVGQSSFIIRGQVQGVHKRPESFKRA